MAAVLLLGTGLLACGGGDGDGAAEEIERTARLITTDKTAGCERLTQAALERYAGKSGPDALVTCNAKIKAAQLPQSAKVEVIDMTGNRASVGYHTNTGVTGAMALKKSGGRWLVDKVVTIPPSQDGAQ